MSGRRAVSGCAADEPGVTLFDVLALDDGPAVGRELVLTGLVAMLRHSAVLCQHLP